MSILDEQRLAYMRKADVYSQMVGRLYPEILYVELWADRERYLAAGGLRVDLPDVYPPRDGYTGGVSWSAAQSSWFEQAKAVQTSFWKKTP